jgi:hypothetical protein
MLKLFEDFTGDGYHEEVVEGIHRALLEYYEGEEFNIARQGDTIQCVVVYDADDIQFRYERPDGRGELSFFAKFDGVVTFTPVFKDLEELRFLWEIGVGDASELLEELDIEVKMTLHVGKGVDWSSSFSWNTTYTRERIQQLGARARTASTEAEPDFYKAFRHFIGRKFWYFDLDIQPKLDAAERSLTRYLDRNLKKYF